MEYRTWNVKILSETAENSLRICVYPRNPRIKNLCVHSCSFAVAKNKSVLIREIRVLLSCAR